ncbi:MAG: acylphosphatase [Candidatus Paceibacterota bacterium]
MSGKNLDYDHLLWINKIANQLDLTGITFFHNDGSVKVIAEGEENILLFFIKKLKRGPSFFPLFSPVENFSIIWQEPKNEFKNFSISEALE